MYVERRFTVQSDGENKPSVACNAPPPRQEFRWPPITSRVNPTHVKFCLKDTPAQGTFHAPKILVHTNRQSSGRLTSEIAWDTAPWSSAGVGLWDRGADPLAVVIALLSDGSDGMDGPGRTNERRAFGVWASLASDGIFLLLQCVTDIRLNLILYNYAAIVRALSSRAAVIAFIIALLCAAWP